jgi:hypothetical protein
MYLLLIELRECQVMGIDFRPRFATRSLSRRSCAAYCLVGIAEEFGTILIGQRGDIATSAAPGSRKRCVRHHENEGNHNLGGRKLSRAVNASPKQVSPPRRRRIEDLRMREPCDLCGSIACRP